MSFLIIDNTKDLGNAEMTPRLINYFEKRDIHVIVVSKQEELQALAGQKIKGIILSGGPILLSEKTELFRYSKNFTVLIEYSEVPILGICFGFQIMGMAHGGCVKSLGEDRREKIYETIHVCQNNQKIPINRQEQSCLFQGLGNTISVYQCHNDYLENCPVGFRVTSRSADGIIESIECPEKLRFGVQFHPENSLIGHKILDNFVTFCEEMETLKSRFKWMKG